MPLPEFRTPRLILRPRGMADLDACLDMDRDPEVARYIPGPWADPGRHRRFVMERMTADFGPGLGYWSIFPAARPAEFAGWILLIPEDGTGPDVEIGWRLNRAFRGRGLASEAAAAILAHAFTLPGLDRVVARIDPRNAASAGVARRIGMRLDARGAAADLHVAERRGHPGEPPEAGSGVPPGPSP